MNAFVNGREVFVKGDLFSKVRRVLGKGTTSVVPP